MHRQFLSAVGACCFVGVALTGCAPAEPVGRNTLEVIGGTETGDAHEGVVYVTAEIARIGGAPITKAGSGSLVASNLVATALHVVSRNPSNVPFTCDATGNDVSGSQGSLLGAPVAAEKVAIYAGPYPDGEPIARGVQLVTSGSTTICQNDIAFVVLDQALDLELVPIHRGSKAEPGDALTAVGFGGEQMDQLNPRTAREVSVTAVGQWIRTFTVSEGPCEGDSGGPALSATGELAGVFSSVSMDCTNANASAKYTDMSFFSPLVELAFDAAGAGSPWPEAEGGAAGSPSVDPSEAGGGGGESAAGSASAAVASVPSRVPRDSGCTFRAPSGMSHTALWTMLLGSVLLVLARRGQLWRA